MLLLDSEALSAMAHRRPKHRHELVRALIWRARKNEHPVGISSAVLAEVVRGHPRDAAVFALLAREQIRVHPVDTGIGIRAGRLMGAARMSSLHAVDAVVVAVGDAAGGAVIATVDNDDIGRLAQYASRVTVADIR